MIRSVKKVILSALSILGISMLFWIVLLLNPHLSYAHVTKFDNVKVYHNEALEHNTEKIINDALSIIRKSQIQNNNISIQLCLNDNKIYPNLQPWVGRPLAYAFLNKTVICNGKVRFNENAIEAQWKINNYEFRRFDLTYLLAHEFMHNLQCKKDFRYYFSSTMGKINWKLEGHAEYISRQFQNDGLLKSKIELYLVEVSKDHIGIPVFNLEDGTKQSLDYYKNALIIQYLMEEKCMDYGQICALEYNVNQCFDEMLLWKAE